jgi:hypothetical protein
MSVATESLVAPGLPCVNPLTAISAPTWLLWAVSAQAFADTVGLNALDIREVMLRGRNGRRTGNYSKWRASA